MLDAVAGFGPLHQYLDDPTIEEIWVNEPSRVFVARGGTAELTTTILTADEVRDLVERMLKSSGRRVDLLGDPGGVDIADDASAAGAPLAGCLVHCGTPSPMSR